MLYICSVEKEMIVKEGMESPLFLYQKMLEKRVQELLKKALENRSDLFLISLIVTPDAKINVIVDGDNGVKVEDCIYVSRAIEHELDREEQDFSLEVMSAGALEPLINMRQYKKNIGRNLEVKTSDSKIEGKLVDANDDAITLQWKTREPKPIGKGKVTVQKRENIAYNIIIEAKVLVKF